jgi:hypothetical protein
VFKTPQNGDVLGEQWDAFEGSSERKPRISELNAVRFWGLETVTYRRLFLQSNSSERDGSTAHNLMA